MILSTKVEKTAANAAPENVVLAAIVAHWAVLVRLAQEGFVKGTVVEQDGFAQLTGRCFASVHI